MRYQVKWVDKSGATRYGIYRNALPGKKGLATVDDAVLPYYYDEVPEKDLVDVETEMGEYDMKTGTYKGGDEMAQYVSNAYLAEQ